MEEYGLFGIPMPEPKQRLKRKKSKNKFQPALKADTFET